MLLPGRNEARVPLSKLVEYLLSETHAVGRSKAKFFRGLGFNETNVAVLEQGLLSLAQMETIVEVVESPFGTKYVVDGLLKTPGGALVRVRTVWIIEMQDSKPVLITAYPA